MLLIRNAVAGPIASTSVSRRDAINGVQDAAAVSGTELIISGAPTTNALPDRTTCFSDKGMNHCYGILHHWFSMANHAFCSKANGLVFSLSNTNTSVNMTYLYQPVSEVGGKGERGNVYVHANRVRSGSGYARSGDDDLFGVLAQTHVLHRRRLRY